MSYNPQPPGWYRADGDPPNTVRYWDGTTWIGEPAPMPASGTPSAPVPPASGYGQPYGYAPSYPESSQAVTSLVLSLLGLLFCGVLAIPGWIIGQREVTAIDQGRRPPENRGTANAGRIIGIITVVLYVVGILFFVIVAGVSISAA